jgi:hypothetical protein
VVARAMSVAVAGHVSAQAAVRAWSGQAPRGSVLAPVALAQASARKACVSRSRTCRRFSCAFQPAVCSCSGSTYSSDREM